MAMIGVLATEDEREAVEEFFELFKTPWEWFSPTRDYDVVLAPAKDAPESRARVQIHFGSRLETRQDASIDAERRENAVLRRSSGTLPLCGESLCFSADRRSTVEIEEDGVVLRRSTPEGARIRLGYNLFAEVRTLLAEGQSAGHAPIPTLEHHIDLLRGLITSCGVRVVEVPPVPSGHPFTVCLTHDIDHPLLRNHFMDHTALGFLFRATLGSAFDVLKRRITVCQAARNWLAALCYPLVHLRMAGDFWAPFDRYMDYEEGLASTFFVIPRPGDPGRGVDSSRRNLRAASYRLEQIRLQLTRILEKGGEVALHGIDAWMDRIAGDEERRAIAEVTGRPARGVRMHWLCFDASSPGILDSTGFEYDSSVGFNGSVGYRAGTLQAYRPPGTRGLIEIPLHIMDTALFYPAHMNLTRCEATRVTRQLFADAVRHGGVLTINWHDRSIAPERQWGGFYLEMLDELKQMDPWFATMSDAASWFRLRRSVRFEEVRHDGRAVKVRVSAAGHETGNLPGLRLRVTGMNSDLLANNQSISLVEEEFRGEAEMTLAA